MFRSTNGEGNNNSRDNWETPKELFYVLNSQYNFGFDCCATNVNKKCENYSSDWASVTSIDTVAWMNPPFSIASEMFEHFFEIVAIGVAIYRCDNFETKIWQKIIFPKASWVFIPLGRINYEGSEGTGARFPSALIGVGLPPPKLLDGTIIKKYNLGANSEE